MKGQMTIIRPNGETEVREYVDQTPWLEVLQEEVGGQIEYVPMFDTYEGQPAVVYCDEEGKLTGKVPNQLATQLWYDAAGRTLPDVLVGTILVLTGDIDFMLSL